MPEDDKSLILSVNAGSSSLKISVFRLAGHGSAEPVSLVVTSSISNISSPPAKVAFSFADPSKSKNNSKGEEDGIDDHAAAFAHFLKQLKESGGVESDSIRHICHRVVHGGDYKDPVVIYDESYHHIERLTDLAPLHNGSALSVIQASRKHLPNATSIAYFDTTFHRSIPPHISSYAIDPKNANPRGLKKYGFHGLSYTYILRAVSSFLQKPASETSLIVMHLGSGASVCAISAGQSFDTSMGLTPVHGLPGATRSGAVDPSLIFHYTNTAGRISHDKAHAIDVGVTEAEEILNKKSGWKALTGTADFGEVVAGRKDDPAKALAFDLLVDRILDFVGAYYVKLSGRVDALVFSGGIGEKSAELRSAVVARCACLGFALDEGRNKKVDEDDADVVEIGEEGGSKGAKRVLVCRTDEQAEMARQCALEEKYWS